MKRSVYARTVLVYSALIAVIYLIGLGITVSSMARVRAQVLDAASAQLEFTASALDTNIDYLKRQQAILSDSYYLQRLYLYAPNTHHSAIYASIQNTKPAMNALQGYNPYVEDVAVFFPNLHRALRSGGKFAAIRAADAKRLDRMAEGDDVIALDGDLYIVHDMQPGDNNASPAALSYIRLSGARILRTLSNLTASNGMYVQLRLDGRSVIASGEAVPPEHARAAEDRLGASGAARFPLSTAGASSYVLCTGNTPTGVELVAFLPSGEVDRFALFPHLAIIAALTVATLLGAVLFQRWMHRKLQEPVAALTSAFLRVESDNLEARIDNNETSEEFAYLFDAFNAMAQRLQSSMRAAYQQTIATQRAELKQLQSQINPHFLYNSFSHLYRMAKLGDAETVAELSLLLSQYYQYITRNAADAVPLHQEMQHAKNYVDIQTMRFGARIACDFGELPEGFADMPVPKLILQPLLENAYVHGLEEATSGARIAVRFASQGRTLHIAVEDNGGTLDDAGLQSLRARLRSKEPGEETTGLLNIARRIEYFYGPPSRLYVERSRAGGLRVCIEIAFPEVDHAPNPDRR